MDAIQKGGIGEFQNDEKESTAPLDQKPSRQRVRRFRDETPAPNKEPCLAKEGAAIRL